MEKNAIGQRSKNFAQTTSDKMSDDQDTTGTIVKDDTAEKISPLITSGVDVSTGVDSGVANDTDNGAGTTIIASAVSDSNQAVINGAVEEAQTVDITTAASSPSSVIDGDAAPQPVTKLARRKNLDDKVVSPDPDRQQAPGSAAAVATSRDPSLELTIRATASSWVEIVRGDGTAVLKKLMRAGESYVVDDGSALYLSTGNAGGIEIVTAGNEITTIGKMGEIVRDLPLAKNRLRERF